MAITVTTQANVSLTAGANTEVLDAQAGRKGFFLQLQGPGFAWVKMASAADVNDGIRIGAWESVPFSGGAPAIQGNGTDYYEGTVNVFYEGGAYRNTKPTAVNLRVIELT